MLEPDDVSAILGLNELGWVAHAPRARSAFCGGRRSSSLTRSGYLPVMPGGGNLFFSSSTCTTGRGATILTSNRALQNGARSSILSSPPHGSTRLLDHAVVTQIEGSSYHLRRHTHAGEMLAPPRSSTPNPGAAATRRMHRASPARRDLSN